jgi:signal transduction histidine kinase/ligand-binding sensor domain-containing protein
MRYFQRAAYSTEWYIRLPLLGDVHFPPGYYGQIRKSRKQNEMAIRLLCILAAMLMFCCETALSQGAESGLQQLNHRTYTANDGGPIGIFAIAQTADGILWIGGENGLTRFDGARFVPYPQAGEQPLRQNDVDTLLVASDGSLWIGFRPTGVAVMKNGHVTSYGEADGLPNGTVAQIAQDRQGGIWAATRTGLAHLVGKRWQRVQDDGAKMDSTYGVLVDRAGALWVTSTGGLFTRASGQSAFERIDNYVYDSPFSSLTEGPDGDIWAGSKAETIRIEPRSNVSKKEVVVLRGVSGGPLLVDRKGDLWGSDRNPNGLLRVSSSKLSHAATGEIAVQPEMLARDDGLRSNRVFSLFEDRENNIWVGTNEGLHRFSHSNVVRAAPPCAQGVFVAAAVAAGDSGALWMACTDAVGAHVDEVRNGAVVSHNITPDFSSLYRAHDGIVWLAGSTHMGHIDGHQIIIDREVPEFVRGRPPQALMHERGATWISFSRRATYRIVDGQWTEYGGLSALPRAAAYVIFEDSKGAIWFGYSNNRVARVDGNGVRVYDGHEGFQVGNVMSIIEKEGRIWVAGELGLACFDGSRFNPVHSSSGNPFRGISGVVGASNGDLWINGTNGIVHVARTEVLSLLEDSAHPVNYEVFNYLDGVLGTAGQLRPLPSAIEATDGRIWFSTTAGVVSIDASRLSRNSLPPPVKIWSVMSNAKTYTNLGGEIQLPVHTAELRIPYSAGSLSVPERVRFKYKLEGSDHDWQDVGSRREAVYTNLSPGHYVFRVTASNNDGIWNNTGGEIKLSIAPAFYQTIWFYALCALAFMGMMTEAYKLRMRQVAVQVRGRLEARLAERERIARELHDTLLQGVQGLIWRFQAVSESLPVEYGRERMEDALDRADRLLAESRDRVKDLRPSPGSMANLADALASEGEQLAQLKPANFRVTVQGVHRELHPIVREEGFLIAREAIANAFQHSRAANIEVEVIYDSPMLQVRVRDDGEGIDPSVLGAGGKPAHFGLIGMRERAKRLGGQFEVWSKPAAGTEVDLRVPASVAYREPLSTLHKGIRSRITTQLSADTNGTTRPSSDQT